MVHQFNVPPILAILSLGLLHAGAALAGPVTIDYQLVPSGAPNRYEYRYTVTNGSLASPVAWFSIDFDAALYDESSLLITSSGLSNWSEQILGSVPILGVPAQYDAYKTTGTPLAIGDSEAGFAVQFTWLGAGTPGGQAFTVYDPGNLNVLYAGLTTPVGVPPSVPEPATAALALLALAGAAAVRRRKSHTPKSGVPSVTAA